MEAIAKVIVWNCFHFSGHDTNSLQSRTVSTKRTVFGIEKTLFLRRRLLFALASTPLMPGIQEIFCDGEMDLRVGYVSLRVCEGKKNYFGEGFLRLRHEFLSVCIMFSALQIHVHFRKESLCKHETGPIEVNLKIVMRTFLVSSSFMSYHSSVRIPRAHAIAVFILYTIHDSRTMFMLLILF